MLVDDDGGASDKGLARDGSLRLGFRPLDLCGQFVGLVC